MHQLSNVFEGYQNAVDPAKGTEVITEVYVSKEAFLPFMTSMREDVIKHDFDVTYGTIRMIKKDTESFLAWARADFVCIICNLHVKHTEQGIQTAKKHFRLIIDHVIEHGGSFYLTYHKWATKKQVSICHPEIVPFLKFKKKYDPLQLFQSNWYRHYKAMFSEESD